MEVVLTNTLTTCVNLVDLPFATVDNHIMSMQAAKWTEAHPWARVRLVLDGSVCAWVAARLMQLLSAVAFRGYCRCLQQCSEQVSWVHEVGAIAASSGMCNAGA